MFNLSGGRLQECRNITNEIDTFKLPGKTRIYYRKTLMYVIYSKPYNSTGKLSKILQFHCIYLYA